MDEALAAYQKAISLTTERGVRQYLEARRDEVATTHSGGA
jgi:predicted RNA polymerase sigma factor